MERAIRLQPYNHQNHKGIELTRNKRDASNLGTKKQKIKISLANVRQKNKAVQMKNIEKEVLKIG
jgi:hypothetical protein